MPPIVTWLGWSALTRGYCAHLKFLNSFGLVRLHRRIDERVVQLEGGRCPLSIASRFWSSICTDSDGSAAGEEASCFMIVQRLARPARPCVSLVAFGLSTLPPALATQRVEPDDDALVLRALDLDEVRLALLGQGDRVCDHLVPGRRRLRDEVGAVPEQLGVAVVRHRVELALPDRGVERAPSACPCSPPALLAPVHGQDPAGFGELGLPGDVEAEDVQRAVLRGQAADQLLALAVGAVRQLVVLDLVLAAALRGAVSTACCMAPELSGKL